MAEAGLVYQEVQLTLDTPCESVLDLRSADELELQSPGLPQSWSQVLYLDTRLLLW